jgi:hypothetical protein
VKAAHCFAVMEYARPSDATAAFDAVMDAPWCEDDGFLCRWLPPAPKNPAEAMWLKSYRRVDRSVRLRGTLDRTLVGTSRASPLLCLAPRRPSPALAC